MTDHRHLWNTPVDDRTGQPTGPCVCEVCGKEPEAMRCENCGALVDETVIQHGSLRRGLHRTRKPKPVTI